MSDDLDIVEAAAPEGGVAASAPRPARRVLKRVLVGLALGIAALAAVAALLYFFGGMERPAAEYRVAFGQLVDAGRVAPVDGRFVIPIPGCRCHSDDPVLTMQHSVRRIRECAGCHAR